MSDPEPTLTLGSVLSVIFDSLGAIVRAVFNIQWSWYFAWLIHILSLPWKIVMIPLSFVARVLLVVFAPALYIVSYVFSWVKAVFAFLALLEPLYTFFGAAAAVGIVAGIILGMSSSLLTSYLGMQGEDEELEPKSSKQRYLQESTRRWDSSSAEVDWQWLESPSQRRRPAAGLLSQTIHEEDDDSEF
ncbi:Fc.00g053010.m01.CDS01 [Cosmosporella sp. VM-42]